MKTQFYTATSLDGFIATEDDSLASLQLVSVRQVGSGFAELSYIVPKGPAS